MSFQIPHGDAREILPTYGAESIDSIVTDPPYELGFMGKAWDSTGIAYDAEFWRECLRVLKPGGHLLAFGGTRTYHRMACAIEDAGFEIRDQLQWLYGSGFPKSLDVSKAIDKMHGAERKPTGEVKTRHGGGDGKSQQIGQLNPDWKETAITAPATDEAKQWNGWGTALKPANEPICLARKPLEKGLTVAQNVLKWGTGALNIDACRIKTNGDVAGTSSSHSTPQEGWDRPWRHNQEASDRTYAAKVEGNRKAVEIGRWPANVIHDGSDEVLEYFPDTASGQPSGIKAGGQKNVFGVYAGGLPVTGFGDEGSAARFFYCAKAAQSERNRNSNNNHPTVKPIDLMAYLCRLITPPKGIVLDPFNGSGSTGIAAVQQGFCYIGIELEAEYIDITKKRLSEIQVNLF